MRTPDEDRQVTQRLREFDSMVIALLDLGIAAPHLRERIANAESDVAAASGREGDG